MNLLNDFGIIYKVTNIINGKIYIGQTIQSLYKRWYRHCNSKEDCRYFCNAIRKYGKENFIINIIEIVMIDKLDEREKYWIQRLSANIKGIGYNILIGGKNGNKGRSKLTNSEIEELIRLNKQHISHIKIGKKFNINRKTVTFILRRYTNYKSKFKKLEDFNLNEINVYFRLNHPTLEEVRIKYRISNSTIYKIAKLLNYSFKRI